MNFDVQYIYFFYTYVFEKQVFSWNHLEWGHTWGIFKMYIYEPTLYEL